MNTVCCISTKMSTLEKVAGTKHRASSPLQKVGRHVPLSTHGLTPVVGLFQQLAACDDIIDVL